MADGPGFDPFALLGVPDDADDIVIQLAYRARIRAVHPDVAGPAGLAAAKRLNVARDWLLDPVRRASLPRGSRQATRTGTAASKSARRRSAGVGGSSVGGGVFTDQPQPSRAGSSDLGPHGTVLRAFLLAIERLTPDERARVNYSLGDARPVAFEVYREYLDPLLWQRSQALRQMVDRTWARGVDDPAPLLPPLGLLLPTGFLVANAYAQWLLLGDFFREALAGTAVRGEYTIEALDARCRGPWDGAVGQPRYGPRQAEVQAFFALALSMPADAATRLARSWQRHLGRDARGRPARHLGPGVWLPAPAGCPQSLRVSGFLAAVDASRLAPPDGLAEADVASFRYALRLTAHVLALGLPTDPAHDYLRPWREAIAPAADIGA
jgi:hypothetical protein